MLTGTIPSRKRPSKETPRDPNPNRKSPAILTIGEALASPEQFTLRSRQLHDAASWIAVAPHFSHNLGWYFRRE